MKNAIHPWHLLATFLASLLSITAFLLLVEWLAHEMKFSWSSSQMFAISLAVALIVGSFAGNIVSRSHFAMLQPVLLFTASLTLGLHLYYAEVPVHYWLLLMALYPALRLGKILAIEM